MREYVKSGAAPEFALWNPADLGYLSVYVLNALATGEIKGEAGEKFTAGKLGEYTIGRSRPRSERPAWPAVHLEQRQHRRLQLVSRKPTKPIQERPSAIAPIPALPEVPAPSARARIEKHAMKRVGFQFKVRQDRLAEYKEHHKHVWPEMLEALRETGWHNYSLFMRADGLIFGYFETDESLAVPRPRWLQRKSTLAGSNSWRPLPIPMPVPTKVFSNLKNISTWISHDRNYLALDLGAESGRAIVGTLRRQPPDV